MLKSSLLGFIFSLFFLWLGKSSIAQNIDANWHFGYGTSLNFDQNTPPKIGTSELFTDEGCASISTENGKLLFYTDGVTVWNNKNSMMKNGSNLYGHKSSTQAALIVPKPGWPSLYYIFTTTEKAGQNGLCYSIVNMLGDKTGAEAQRIKNTALKTPDLSNEFGLGEVIKKNIPLLGDACEKLSAVYSKEKNGYWVVAHRWNSNAFYSYFLDENGLSEPVVSNVGSEHKNASGQLGNEAIGQMTINNQGNQLALVISYRKNSYIELFDFDINSGLLTNVTLIPAIGYPYGVCFSPNSSKLYVTYIYGKEGLIQYDLKAKSIAASKKTLKLYDPINVFGSMQIGPDNKIYIARTGKYISRIELPDNENCLYTEKAIELKNSSCMYGLPNFPVNPHKTPTKPIIKTAQVSYDNVEKQKLNLGPDTVHCGNELQLDAGITEADYLWNNGAKTKQITVNKSGLYWVKVGHKGVYQTDSIEVTIVNTSKSISLSDTSVKCVDHCILNCGIDGAKYKWSTGEETKEIIVDKSDFYSVLVEQGSCQLRKKVYVKFVSKPTKWSYLPAFKPDAPFNNYFAYTINNVKTFDLKVYNNAGKTLFHTTNPKEFWKGKLANGKNAPRGKYKWEVNYLGECSPAPVKEKGTLKVL